MEKWRRVWIYEPGYGKEACAKYGKLGIIGVEMLMNDMRPTRSQRKYGYLHFTDIITFRYCRAYDGEGNDNPFQYSCLENPMDGGA